jgi:hypothetical protein
VVVDRRIDQAADTGFFEMIYKQVIPKTPAYMGEFKKIIFERNLLSFFKFFQVSICHSKDNE